VISGGSSRMRRHSAPIQPLEMWRLEPSRPRTCSGSIPPGRGRSVRVLASPAFRRPPGLQDAPRYRSSLRRSSAALRRCLIGDTFKLEGPFWDAIGSLNDNFGVLGYGIIAVFALSWPVSVLIYRAKGYDGLDVEARA
jgi:hypothetical protein